MATVTGKILSILALKQGDGKNGPWRNQQFIVESEGSYPKKVCLKCAGKNVEHVSNIAEGDVVEVSYSPESREFNAGWYTDLMAYNVRKITPSVQETKPDVQDDDTQQQTETSEDLPF